MTTLREEIDQLLYEEMFEPYGISQTNFIRNGVLRILEKRIEELYQNDEVLGYSGDAEVSYGITLFHDMIKKELLK